MVGRSPALGQIERINRLFGGNFPAYSVRNTKVKLIFFKCQHLTSNYCRPADAVIAKTRSGNCSFESVFPNCFRPNNKWCVSVDKTPNANSPHHTISLSPLCQFERGNLLNWGSPTANWCAPSLWNDHTRRTVAPLLFGSRLDDFTGRQTITLIGDHVVEMGFL